MPRVREGLRQRLIEMEREGEEEKKKKKKKKKNRRRKKEKGYGDPLGKLG